MTKCKLCKGKIPIPTGDPNACEFCIYDMIPYFNIPLKEFKRFKRVLDYVHKTRTTPMGKIAYNDICKRIKRLEKQ